jgi:hypothetical protein
VRWDPIEEEIYEEQLVTRPISWIDPGNLGHSGFNNSPDSWDNIKGKPTAVRLTGIKYITRLQKKPHWAVRQFITQECLSNES